MIKLRMGCVVLIFGVSACTTFGGSPEKSRLSEDFSYYEPFDNEGETGPDYLIGPPPKNEVIQHLPDSRGARALPSIPDRSLPRSCLSCD